MLKKPKTKKKEGKVSKLLFGLLITMLVFIVVAAAFTIKRFFPKKDRKHPISDGDHELSLHDVKKQTYNFMPLHTCWRKKKVSRDPKRTPHDKLRVLVVNWQWAMLSSQARGVESPGVCVPRRKTGRINRPAQMVARIVRDVDPDIVHLFEIDDCNTLRALENELRNSHQGHMFPGTDRETGLNVGILTKTGPEEDMKRIRKRMAYTAKGKSRETGIAKQYVTRLPLKQSSCLLIGADIATEASLSPEERQKAQLHILKQAIGEHRENNKYFLLIGRCNKTTSLSIIQQMTEAGGKNNLQLEEVGTENSPGEKTRIFILYSGNLASKHNGFSYLKKYNTEQTTHQSPALVEFSL
ncbi:MAG: uncharacterized protein A8A55_1612 [Amphiamblys sp. WSBS2006]|nr:MAG: uncharacterized protein A8A55_1612 [Amphiamblys sp. WSBS2006]